MYITQAFACFHSTFVNSHTWVRSKHNFKELASIHLKKTQLITKFLVLHNCWYRLRPLGNSRKIYSVQMYKIFAAKGTYCIGNIREASKKQDLASTDLNPVSVFLYWWQKFWGNFEDLEFFFGKVGGRRVRPRFFFYGRLPFLDVIASLLLPASICHNCSKSSVASPHS